MTDARDREDKERAEIEALLPWYVTGRLEDDDAGRVAAYLAAHPDMVRQIGMIEDDRAAAVAENEAVRGPRPAAFERLMDDIAADEAASARGALRRAKAGLFGWLGGALRGLSPGQLGYVAAAGVGVIALQAGVIVSSYVTPERPQGAVYEAAGGAERAGTAFLLRFKDDVSMAAITQFLSQNDGRIVAGPRPGGVYTVRFGASKLPETEREALQRRLLQRKDLIQLVAPSE